MNWSEQICLLTGASGGIGQAMAKALADKGVTLILQGRNEAQLQRLALSLPGEHRVLVGDISQPSGIDAIINTLQTQGDLTMLINNAGVSQFDELENTAIDQISANIATNLQAPILLTRGLMNILKKAPQGMIVNIGSTFGSIGFACHSVYCATKFGLRGFTESLLRELANTSVKVMYLAPRATKTEINSAEVMAMNQELGNQVDEAESVAKALIEQMQSGSARKFIGFPEKLFVRVNGSFPALVDNALIKKLPIIKRYAANLSKEVLA